MHAKTRHANPLFTWIAIVGAVAVFGVLIAQSLLAGDHGGHHEIHAPPYWGFGMLPFAGILAAIAVLPLLRRTHHWWESNLNRLAVALVCGAATLVYYVVFEGPSAVSPVLQHAIVDEYIPFIVLLFALYVISGGISIKGDLAAHPITNTAILAFGAGIASFIGTTGASMLLIRPLLQTNAERKHVVHTVVFFIFLVSNVGGTLLPIGDPPLFLGYLRGVPFLWTFGLWIDWAICCVVLLIVYFIWDTLAYRREAPRDIRRDESHQTPLRLRGWINFLWLAGVVVAVALIVPDKPLPFTAPPHVANDASVAVVEVAQTDSSRASPDDAVAEDDGHDRGDATAHGDAPAEGIIPFPFLREIAMLAFVAFSLLTTPTGVREDNRFNYHAIFEVAALFLGIFIAMQVPVQVLKAHGDALGLTAPWHYFWATGSLSSVLDNAPTYVVFFETANAVTPNPGPGILDLIGGGHIREDLLVGISLGAVFMGAMTYIGNGPNFMVKAIAEQSGVRMPSFFGYVARYSLPVLVPLFIVITILRLM